MKADDNDKLWELLGKAEQPEVSPFFARNVLRSVRQETAREEAAKPRAAVVFSTFVSRAGSHVRNAGTSLRRWAWQYTLAGTCAVAALIAVLPSLPLRHHHSAAEQPKLIAAQIARNPDYEVINHLDELVADEESSVWLDDSAH